MRLRNRSHVSAVLAIAAAAGTITGLAAAGKAGPFSGLGAAAHPVAAAVRFAPLDAGSIYPVPTAPAPTHRVTVIVDPPVAAPPRAPEAEPQAGDLPTAFPTAVPTPRPTPAPTSTPAPSPPPCDDWLLGGCDDR